MQRNGPLYLPCNLRTLILPYCPRDHCCKIFEISFTPSLDVFLSLYPEIVVIFILGFVIAMEAFILTI